MESKHDNQLDINQISNLKIADIKTYLTSNQVDSDVLAAIRLDERKGVQTALNKYDKELAKAMEIEKRITELRALERQLHEQGYTYVAGVDEVGRGPLAGPVVTSAVILPADMPGIYFNDSKQLSHAKRQALVADIEKYAISYTIGERSAEEIDASNILIATKQAMVEAIEKLAPAPEYVLIDAVYLDEYKASPQKPIIKGDATVYAIAAASIYAKEYRDRLMTEYADLYPGYGFELNAGYGTKLHLDGLEKYGPSPIHRKSFAPVKKYL